MKVRDKIVYGIAGLIGFLPLSILVVVQSIFALEGAYDSKLLIDANEITVVDIIIYDSYNNDISYLLDASDEAGKPILVSIIEASTKHTILDLHGGKINGTQINISAIQFELADNTKTELLTGIVYLQYKNVDMTIDSWLTDFIEDTNILYKTYYDQPSGTIPYIWVKIITASLGTLLGIATVGFIILRKSTKALVKRYWRIAVLVALVEGTIILGLIAWIVTDMFQVFAAATIGWMLFLGTEKLAKIKGYLDTATTTGELPEALPELALATVQADIQAVLSKYRK
jgi:hypothetical protein